MKGSKDTNMKKGLTKRAAEVLLLAMFAPALLRAQTYEVKTLNGLGGAAGANSLNNRGQVLGQANNETNTISHAALWTAGSQRASRVRAARARR